MRRSWHEYNIWRVEQLNERQLQGQLTPVWAKDGLTIAGRPCLLVARELMFPSWQTNH